VKVPRHIKNSVALYSKISKFIRIKRYTPAVTRVDECTKADTGVGAAIAAGSQAENGICALFVQAEIIIKKINTLDKFISELFKNKYVQSPKKNIREREIKRPTSPNRLVRAVIIPAL